MAIYYPVLILIFVWMRCVTSNTAGPTTTVVSSSAELQSLLCSGYSCNSSTSIVLNSSIEYQLNAVNNFCVVDRTNCTSKLISIQSDNKANLVSIDCTNNNSLIGSNTGIVIINSHVTIKQISLKNCGSLLNTLPTDVLNIFNHSSSPVLYNDTSAAALVLVNCSVDIRNVSFYSINGFGLLGINIYSLVSSQAGLMHIYNSVGNPSSSLTASAAIVLHFLTNNNELNGHNRTILLKNITMEYKYYVLGSCFQNSKYFQLFGGITLIYAQTNFEVNIHLHDMVFHRLILPRIVAIYQFNFLSTTRFERCTFLENSSPFTHCPSTMLAAGINYVLDPNEMADNFKNNHDNTSLVPLIIKNCQFDNSKQSLLVVNRKSIINVIIKSSASASPQIKIEISNSLFFGITGTKDSMCLHVKSDVQAKNTVVNLRNVNATFNSVMETHSPLSGGILVFENIHDVRITGGKSNFSNNFGSAIKSINSQITIYGHVWFIGNQADNGGAIQMIGKSRLIFTANGFVDFKMNTAQFRGGAIYAETAQSNMCPFYFQGSSSVATFKDNHAILSGSSIYSARLFNCSLYNTKMKTKALKPEEILKTILLYFQIIEDTRNSSVLSISTKPVSLKVFKVNYKNSNILYPGQTADIYMAALDALNRSVYSSVQLVSDCSTNPIVPMWHHCSDNSWLSFNQKEQILHEKDKMSILKATIHSNLQGAKNILMTTITVFIDIYGIRKSLILFVHHSCPPGFELDKHKGSCKCSSLISKLNSLQYQHTSIALEYMCSIEYNQFSSTVLDTWAGYVNRHNKSLFAVSNNCPTGNCNFRINDYFYISNEEGLSRTNVVARPDINESVIHQSYVPLCNKHRIGALCGACEKGYSLSLISPTCVKCSNRYLGLNILALLAYGPLLVSFMFIFTLTLSNGFLNGVFFYTNLANIGILDLITLYKPDGRVKLAFSVEIAVQFLEILNANPIFPSCLYDGMNELWKTGIRMLYQFYLWAILLLLIWLSRYSTWLTRKLGRSSIKVFVTLFHISASRMFITLVNVFTRVDLFVEQKRDPLKVWFYDGTVEFFKNGHLVLSVLTLLIVSPLLLAYLFILTFPNKINKTSIGNKYFRPLLEAILNPYKEDKRYWFALRIVLLIVLYCVYASYRGVNFFLIFIITIPVLSLFIMAQIYLQPFKSKFINLLDSVTMINFLLVGMTAWYFILQGTIIPIVIECLISVFFNVAILFAFIGHRILKFLCKFNLIGKLRDRLKATFKYLCLKWKHPSSISQNGQRNFMDVNSMSVESSYNQSCDEFREPLLSSEPASYIK